MSERADIPPKLPQSLDDSLETQAAIITPTTSADNLLHLIADYQPRWTARRKEWLSKHNQTQTQHDQVGEDYVDQIYSITNKHMDELLEMYYAQLVEQVGLSAVEGIDADPIIDEDNRIRQLQEEGKGTQ
jgi:hypothetical protein